MAKSAVTLSHKLERHDSRLPKIKFAYLDGIHKCYHSYLVRYLPGPKFKSVILHMDGI